MSSLPERPMKPRTSLRMEGLEDRSLPSGNVTAIVVGDMLQIYGDDAANQIYIGPSGRRGAFVQSLDGTTTINGQLGRVTFSNISGGIGLHLAGGDDVVGMAEVKVRGALILDTGDGNDVVVTNGVVARRGTRIETGAGNDDVFGFNTKFRGQTVIDAGAGNDRVNLSMSTFTQNATIRGGGGTDVLGLSGNDFRRSQSVTEFESRYGTLVPRAGDDALALTRGTTSTVAVIANDVALQGAIVPSSISILQSPAHGQATANANGTITYTHDGSAATTDTLVYIVRDSFGTPSNLATVTFAISGGTQTPAPTESKTDATTTTEPVVNRAPVAVADTYAATAATPLAVAVASGVLANDSDPDGNALTAALAAAPRNGTLNFNADGSFTYVANAAFVGTDTFTYNLSDGNGGGAIGTASINVTAPVVPPPASPPVAAAAPVANPDAATLDAGASATINLLANDTDADNNIDRATVAVVQQPTAGTVVVNSDGTVTYTSTAPSATSDTFTYTVSDATGLKSNVATVSVSVTGPNTAPFNTVPAAASTGINVPLAFNSGNGNGVLVSDLDAGTGDLMVTLTATNGTIAVSTTTGLTSAAGSGTASLALQGKLGALNTALNTLTYTPATNFAGSATLTVTTNDLGNTGSGGAKSDTDTIAITVSNSNPVAGADTFTTNEDAALTTPAPGVLSNDGDPNGDDVTLTPGTFATSKGGSVVLSANGSFVYTPLANFNGTDTFTYTITDTRGGSATGTAAVTVTAQPDDPTAVADTNQAFQETAVTGNVLDNDFDVDNTPQSNSGLAVTPATVTTSKGGTFAVISNGGYTYTPATGFTGTDTVQYTVTDDTSRTATGTVTFTVVNRNPVPVADSYTTDEGTNLTVPAPGVIGNDTDPDGDTLTAVAGTFPTTQGGSVTIAADGSFVYTPLANFNGTDTFTYTLADSRGGTATGTATVTVTAQPDDPTAVNDTNTTFQATDVTGNVLGNDFDADNTPQSNAGLTATAGTFATTQGGSVTIAADGSYTYTPPANFVGADTFTYTVNDPTARTATGTVTVTVNNRNPVAAADTFSTNEDASLTTPAPGLLSNDTDAPGDTLTAMAGTFATTQGGSVAIAADGSFVYTPLANFFGTDTFSYTVNDNRGGSATGTATITVSATPDDPTAVNDANVTATNTAVSGNVRSNDYDVDNQPPSNTGLVVTAGTFATTQGGSIVFAADGAYTYTPATGFTGTDTVDYTITDPTSRTDAGTLSIGVS